MAFQIGGMSAFETDYASGVVGGLAQQEQQYLQQLGLSSQLMGNVTVNSNGGIVSSGTPTGFGFAGNDNSASMTDYFLGQELGANAGYLAANNGLSGGATPFMFAFGATGSQGQTQYTPISNRSCFCCCYDSDQATASGTGTGNATPAASGTGGIVITSGGPGSSTSGTTGTTGTTPTGKDDDDDHCRRAHHRLHHGHHPHHVHHRHKPDGDKDDKKTTTAMPPIWNGCTCELPPIRIFSYTTSTPPISEQPLQTGFSSFGSQLDPSAAQMYPPIWSMFS